MPRLILPWPLFGVCCSLLLIGTVNTVADESHHTTLLWKNGDQLPGNLLSADAETIQWQSTLFPTPFTLNIDRLDKIQYAEPAISSPSTIPPATMSFRILTVGNDIVYGDLLELTRQHVVLRSKRHGDVRFDRTQIVALQRTDRSSAGAVGLGVLKDWSTLHRGRLVTEWTRDGGGRIVTKIIGAELYRDLHLTSLSEIEVSLSWEGKPGFLLSFAGPDDVRLSRQVVKLETWESDLVLQTLGANGDFVVIHSIPVNTQSLELRLQWNPTVGELRVYTLTGQLLGKMQGNNEAGETLSGLYVQNKGATLALTRLRATGGRVTADGGVPPGTALLHLNDASSVAGRIDSYDSATRLLQVTETASKSTSISLDRVDRIDLGNEPLATPALTSTKISFADGTLISGTFTSIADDMLQIETAYSDQPLNARLDGISEIDFEVPSGDPQPAAEDVASIGEFHLHGRLAPVPDDNQAPGWLPEGGANASSFPTNLPVHIVRASTDISHVPSPSGFVDRIFLRNGDAVPCRIHGINESSVQADFPLTDNGHIDRNLLFAAEFGAFAPAISRGLDDPRWVVTEVAKQAVQRDDNQIVVQDAAMIAYANIRDAAEIQFDLEWGLHATTMIQIHLFTNGPKETSGNPTLMLYRTGGTQVLLQGGAGHARAVSPRPMHDGRNTFRIRMRNKKIFVYEGDTEVLEVPADGQAASGKGLILYVTPLNVNGGAAPAANNKQKLVTLSNVEVRSSGGDLLNMLVDKEGKNRLLTVPRFRKQSPPTEILVGRNGDLLRGRLIALDQQQVTFQSQLDQIEVPRARLSGIVWPLSSDATATDDTTDMQPARIVFHDETIMRMSADRIADGALIGRHPALGAIAVPLALVRQLSLARDIGDSEPSPFASWTLCDAEEPKFATAENPGPSANPGFDSPLVGQAASPFTAELLDATRVRIPDDGGRIVVLDFWASWCGPCVKTMPQTFHTVADFPPEKVFLLAVNQLETPATIREFLAARSWEVPVALDRTGDIGKLFQVDSIPQLFVIGADGRIERVFAGDRPETPEQLKAVLVQLTADQADGGSPKSD